MRQVAAVIETQPQHRVTELEHRLIRAHVCVGPAVRLHVGMIGPEQTLGTVDRERLDIVDDSVATVVTLAGISLGVLVGEDRTDGAHDSGRCEVLAGDQLQPRDLAFCLGIDEVEQFGVGLGVGREWHGSVLHS